MTMMLMTMMRVTMTAMLMMVFVILVLMNGGGNSDDCGSRRRLPEHFHFTLFSWLTLRCRCSPEFLAKGPCAAR